MSTHKYIDRICLAAALLSLLVALLFVNGEALGLQPASRVQGYETRLFDTARVHTIDIVMDGWDDFIETCENEEYAACAAVIDGEAYKNVGIRAKGNTSLSTVSAMDSSRYSFKLEFDHYDSGKTYYGLDKLCLNNIIQDNTYMKDYLTYRMMGEFGVSAPLCSFVFITVNGEEWGLYLAVEGVEESFLQRNYGSQYGMLYKPDSMSFGGGRGNGRDFDMEDLSQLEQFAPPGRSGVFSQQGEEPPAMDEMPGGAMQGRQRPDMPVQEGGKGEGAPGGGMGSDDVKLKYSDDDPDSYSNIFSSAKTDVTEADQARLIQALKTLGEGTDIERAVDVDHVLRYFVVHNFVVNGDSYTGSMVHNYYLYEADGQLSMIPWDYNLAFGTFQARDASAAVNDPIDTPLSVSGDGDRPMADWIYGDAAYTELYHQYFAEFLETVDPAAIIGEAYQLIAHYVERDPTKFCTTAEFETGVDALRTFCRLRAESVSGQLAGTVPSTDDGQSAGDSALVDASALTLSDMGTMNMGGAGDPGGRGGPGEQDGTGPDSFPQAENRPEGSERPSGRMDAMGMEMPDGVPPVGNGPQDGRGAASDSQALLPLLVSVLALLAGILSAWRYRRNGRRKTPPGRKSAAQTQENWACSRR
ncbi:CotH kinase family protein [uncultured Oscillibacter sp.]|uniref:CotH kinase family protein n=3 Tax=uncultured Oscillibacter sp. TaxID=876091 RepID=UPI0026E32DA6|nr:CotH kinase family protein [uncultured Oscillibacter sp.]